MNQTIDNLKKWYKLIVLLNSSADYDEIAKYDSTARKGAE
jgi:hypothetical protein